MKPLVIFGIFRNQGVLAGNRFGAVRFRAFWFKVQGLGCFRGEVVGLGFRGLKFRVGFGFGVRV